MIAEALEAAWLVASALAAWLVVGVVAVTVGLYAAVVGVWLIWRGVRRTMHRLLGARRALDASVSDEVPENVPRLPRPRDRRSTPHSALPPDGEKRSEAA